MASICGIRVGQRRFEVVVVDGSVKKPRVRAAVVGEIPPGEDAVDAAATAIREATKHLKINADEIGLAVDAGLAAFRTLTVPFEDEAKIESVIKFEVESQLPQWDIDQVVVDFEVLGSSGVTSHLLVTAVQKDDLWTPITAAERAHLEPHEAELETTAVLNAAHAAGAFSADAAAVLVHVGESTTSVVVVDGGKLRSMRAIHIGGLIEDPVAAAAAQDESGLLEGIESTPGAPSVREELSPSVPIERRLEEASARVRRELIRTISGAQVAHPFEAIVVCGMELPGLDDTTIDDVPVHRLDVLPEDANVDCDRGVLAAAYGAAIGRMGGGLVSAQLRREELRYTGKFERLELPLAMFCLLLVTLLLVQWIVVQEKITYRQADMRTWLKANNDFAFIGDPSAGVPGKYRNPEETIMNYARMVSSSGDPDRTLFDQLKKIESLMLVEKSKLEKKLGRDGAISQPQSALEGTSLVLGVLADLGKERVGRFSIRSVHGDFNQGASGRPDQVEVRLRMSFFGEGAGGDLVASEHYNNFVNELRSRPWCVEVKPASTETFKDGTGIWTDNLIILVDPTKRERKQEA